MPGTRKPNRQYHFSVEGETEELYLKHLGELINQSEERAYNARFNIKKLSPQKYVKNLSHLNKSTIYHVFDVEDIDMQHKQRFESTLCDLHKASTLKPGITYISCYNNLTFELWIILHKTTLKQNIVNKSNYLNQINKYYNQKLQSLHEYKEERKFKQILNLITLNDVKQAIKNAAEIMQDNESKYKKQTRYKFSWFWENPATTMGVVVSGILKDCGITP